MREETLNPMQEAIAFGRVIPGAAAEFTNEPRAEEFYSDAFSAEGNENSAPREAAKPNAERQSEAVRKERTEAAREVRAAGSTVGECAEPLREDSER